jgi:hypothetical protein
MEHRENTQAILDAYLETEKRNWREIGDLYRELGEFDKAAESFSCVKIENYNESELERLIRANRIRISNPLPI